MKQLLTCAAVLAAVACGDFGGKAGASAAEPVGRISVTLTNDTDLQVYFFLNGGGGLKTSIAPGATGTWELEVDRGVQPVVRVNQLSGRSLAFNVYDGGDYSIRVDDADGKIKIFSK